MTGVGGIRAPGARRSTLLTAVAAGLSRCAPRAVVAATLAALLGCGTGGAGPAGPVGQGAGTASEPVAATPAPAPAAMPTAAPAPASAPVLVAAPVVEVSPAPAPRVGADFTAEARLLFRYVACGTAEPIADAAIAKVVDDHCAWVGKELGKRARYVASARAFFDKIQPADLPGTVVYPFGGGDLISALIAFPSATEITTISLEQAGDPRRITRLTAGQLDASLGRLRGELGGMLSVGSNTSANLSSSQRNELPAQVSSFMLGLAANGFEPVGLRFVRPAPDGSLHYLTADDIAVVEGQAARARGGETSGRVRGKARKGDWLDPNFSDAFAHVEIEYRRLGAPTDPVRVHRHFGWNLHDGEMARHPELLAHLARKGKVVGLVKGASYLLWRHDFATIRGYLLGHIAWMLSDSTGVPPEHARRAGMVQDTFGRFTGAFLGSAETKGKRHSDDFKELWARNPKRKLTFRFGYLDAEKHPHLLVTRPAH